MQLSKLGSDSACNIEHQYLMAQTVSARSNLTASAKTTLPMGARFPAPWHR